MAQTKNVAPATDSPASKSSKVKPVTAVPAVEQSTEQPSDDVRSRLVEFQKKFEQLKVSATESVSEFKSLLKAYDAQMKTRSKKPKRAPRDPSKPVALNGIAKPQQISEELGAFLFTHFQVPKGSLVSRTQALSKDHGIAKYVNDRQLRKSGEIYPDETLIKLLGEPDIVGKSGEKVYHQKTLMQRIGKHFPKKQEPTA